MLSHWERWLLLLLVLVSVIIERWGDQVYQRGSLHRGINYIAWSPEHYRSSAPLADLQHLRALGVTWVAVVVTWYQADPSATEIAPQPPHSPDDADIVRLLRRLRELGFKIFLRPLVDLSDGRWRGEIAFSEEAYWSAWFASYERFLRHYAQLAAREGVTLLSVGVELEKTVAREREWRELIARVRQAFSGPLVYSANWDGFAAVPFWDDLDFIGIDAYFDLALAAEPTLAELISAWQPWVSRLEHFAAKTKQPILFTEAGVRSVAGASRRPWDWRYEGPISLAEQANYYEALFRVFWERPWLAGFYIWAWLPGLGGPEDASYTPAGKPATTVLKRWYSQRR